MTDSVLCVITARGGSKRIPRKNIRDFCGKPIIAYSIEAALQSGLFDEVMVSTDDEEIAHISREYGANVPFFRSAENSDDMSTTTDVLHEVLGEYGSRGKVYPYICCMYPTAPFVTADILRAAWEEFSKSGMDMLQPVVDFGFPPQRAFRVNHGLLNYWMPEFADARSQDLAPLYHDAGQFYFYRSASLDDQDRTRHPFVLNRMGVQDIDTEEDWLLAEAKYRIIRGE